MSLSLDGRLPSGRRSALLQHIAGCEPCARVWEDMKGGQDVALGLPRFGVRGAFRQGLQRRIESGEGAPEAVYRQPIPPLTKVRYLATGAAAAVLIAALHLVSSEDGRQRPAPDTDAVAEVNDSGPLGPGLPFGPPPSAAVDGVQLAGVNELSLAQNFADNCATSAQRLRARLHSLQGRPLQEAWGEVEDVLVDLKTAVGVMQWMDHKRMVTLPGQLKNEFSLAGSMIEQVFNARSSWELRDRALRRLQEMELERVRDRFDVACCRPPEDLFRDIEDLVVRLPEARAMFQIVTVEGPDLHGGPQPGIGPRMLVLRIERVEKKARVQKKD